VTTPALPKLRFVAAPDTSPGRKLPLPSAILSPANRGDSNGEVDALLANVAVEMTWEIGPRSTGPMMPATRSILKPDKPACWPWKSDDGTHRLHPRRRPGGTPGPASPPPAPS
jgi:hypothetical protein